MERESVLWVGGRPEGLLALEAALAPLDLRLIPFDSVDAARHGLVPQHFALLVVDVSPRWEQAAQAVRLLREVAFLRTTPLLLLTDEVHPARLREACALGAVDCLASPPDPEVLRTKVSVFAGLARRSNELEQARAELTEREARLRLVLESSGVGHWHLELATMRLETSVGCRVNFGLRPEEDFSSYDALRALIHPEDLPAMSEAVERSLATRQEYVSDYRVVPPTGRMRWVAIRGQVVVDAAGNP